MVFVLFLAHQATPDMAVTLLEIARIFATKVPGKIDADVLQLLWKVSWHSYSDQEWPYFIFCKLELLLLLLCHKNYN